MGRRQRSLRQSSLSSSSATSRAAQRTPKSPPRTASTSGDCSEKPQVFKVAGTEISLRYAHFSQRGFYPDDLDKANQDAYKTRCEEYVPESDKKRAC